MVYWHKETQRNNNGQKRSKRRVVTWESWNEVSTVEQTPEDRTFIYSCSLLHGHSRGIGNGD